MSRAAWFVAGAGAGVYAVIKARRTAEAFTPEGLADRLAGLSVGARIFGEEVRAGRDQKETDLRERLGLTLHGASRQQITTGPDAPGPTNHHEQEEGND
jgi:hypothetical protein